MATHAERGSGLGRIQAMPVNAFVPASATVDANGIESGGVECVDLVL